MKREDNIYQQICTIENLIVAQKNARKGKEKQHGVKQFDKAAGCNILLLHNMLIEKTYRIGKYKTFRIKDPKERLIFVLNYFPDRIVQHAAMIPLRDIFDNYFTKDTYSCIKNKGVHGALNELKKSLRNVTGTTYYLQLDINKFYPSIDHCTLRLLLRRKFKDRDLLCFLDDIIGSSSGLPIGNYLSQYFANFYLTPFDRFIKEVVKAPYYFRYMDDMVLLHHSKVFLHNLMRKAIEYLSEKLKLLVKSNWRVSPVTCGINFLGYLSFHTHTLLRPELKRNFCRMVALNYNNESWQSYKGWTSHANCNHLIKKLHYERVQSTRYKA